MPNEGEALLARSSLVIEAWSFVGHWDLVIGASLGFPAAVHYLRRDPVMSTATSSILLRPFLPPVEAARGYSLRKLRRDLVAGLTVSVVEVPQSMAYALVAGVPPVYGIYTSVLQGVIGALLSSSEHMTTGPTNTQSLLIASAVTAVVLPGSDPVLYLQLVFALTVFKGLIQLTFAAARLGDLVRYVSRSVVVGLTAGAGVLILVGQLPHFLGLVATPGEAVGSRLPGVIGAMDVLWRRLSAEGINGRAVAVGCAVVAVVVGVRLLSRLLPGALLAVVLAAGAVAALGWSRADVPLIDPLPKGFPAFHAPWEGMAYARDLFGGALALAVLGMLETVAIAKSIASRSGERVVPNQEFFAQGLTNFITGFFQCIPGSGSFTRSALDYAAGAETRFAAVFNALFVAAIFWFAAPLAGYVPLASLAGVLFVIAVGLIDWPFLVRAARTSRGDATVCLVTFGATLLAPLEYAIFVGIFLNLALYLRTASRLHLAEMVQLPGGSSFVERPIHDRVTGERQVLFLQLEGELFFAVADELQDRLTALQHSPVRVVVLRLKRTHSIDATVLHVLEQFTRDMQARGGHVILCGVKPELMATLRGYGLIDVLGRENVFEATTGVFTSAKRALQRARDLVGASIDATGINVDESEAWAYEI
jgi:SulP family sulfate permease